MPNPTELLPHTGIAATSWVQDGQPQLRVYTQDLNGNIRESRYSGTGWTGGTSNDIIVKARPNSPMAATSWADSLQGLVSTFYQTRLYYISPDNIVRELCTDTNKTTWYAGDLDTLKIEASSVSRLASAASTVFYQRPDGAIGNIYYYAPPPIGAGPPRGPVGWVDNGVVGKKPLVGTGLAAVYFSTGDSETSYVRLFYQLPDGQLAEAHTNWAGEVPGGDIPKIAEAAAATNLSVCATGPASFRLLFLNKRNDPFELVYSDDKWSTPKRSGHFLPVPGSDSSIIQVYNGDTLRLYVQDDNNVIQEYRWEKGYTEWVEASLIPVGNLQ